MSHVHAMSEEGRAIMKEMASVYFGMLTSDLRRLKGKKQLRLIKLRNEYMTYTIKQEIRTLEFQLSRIDAVLLSRAQQGQLFP